MSLPNEIRIGTRHSALALTQTDLVTTALLAAWPAVSGRIRICPMSTTGDVIRDRPLYDIGGKALFCRELDQALLDGHIDLAVHSLKDVPTELPHGLCLAAVLPRADVRDVLVSRTGASLHQLPPGAVVGTSSPRRRAILAAGFPHLLLRPIRGNVPTRLDSVATGHVDAVVLAAAGLHRLGLTARITATLPPETMLPAAAQGIIGIVCHADNRQLRQLLGPLNHTPTLIQARCERAVLATLDGSCRTPIGAWAEITEDTPDTLILHGLLAAPDGSRVIRVRLTGSSCAPESLGQAAGHAIIAEAGPAFMAMIRGD